MPLLCTCSPVCRNLTKQRQHDRVRGLVGTAVDAPLRQSLLVSSSSAMRTPSPVKRAKDEQASVARQRAMKMKQRDADAAVSKGKALFAEKMRRAKEAKRHAEEARAEQARCAKAKLEAEDEARQQRASAEAAWDARLRAELKKCLDAEEEANAEAAARRMRDQWRKRPPPTWRLTKSDPYGEWRGSVDTEEEEEEGVNEAELAELSDEEAAARRAKARERDQAAERVLAHSSELLTQALGLAETASDSEVARAVRATLRLLHPDYAINRDLVDGSRRQRRIEAAYKRLNCLRDAAV